MARTITLTFEDGTKHIYQNAPDFVTPEQVQARAAQEFVGRKVVHIDGGLKAAIPGQEGEDARKALARIQTEAHAPGIVQKAVGAGEALLSTATGMTGGALGMIGGTLKGLAEQILSGKFGTQEAARLVEQSAMQGAEALTYAPRTEAGQEYTQAVGTAMQNLVPVGAVSQTLAVPGSISAATQAGRVAAAAGLDRAASAMPAGVRARVAVPGAPVAPAAPAAAPVVQPMTQEAIAATAKKAAEGGIGSAKAERVLAEQAAPDPVKVAAAQRLGIEDYLQPDHVTSNEAYRQVSAVLKSSNPGSALSLAEREGLSRVAQRAADLVEEMGGTRDLSQLDQTLKTRMQTTASQLDASETALYDKIRETIPAKMEAPAENVLAFVRQRADDLGGESKLSALERTILRKLSPKPVRTSETVPGNPLMPGSMRDTTRTAVSLEGPTYTLLDDVRRDVGAAARQRGPFKDADTGLAKKLYSLLTADQEQAANAAGMSEVWAAAKALTTQRKGIEDDLAALFGRDLDRSFLAGSQTGLRGAVASLAQGDAARLSKLLAAVPQDMRQTVVASGLSTVFQKAAADGRMNFTGYAKWYEGLRANRQAYAAVMSNLPLQSRKQLASLYQVSRGISDSLNRRIGTGRLSTVKDELLGKEALMDRLYSLASRSAVGAAAGTVLSPVVGTGAGAAVAAALVRTKPKSMAAVEELIASPSFLHLVRTEANTKQQAAAVKQVAQSKAFEKFLRSLTEPQEIATDREAWLINAMRPAQQPQQAQDPRQAPTN